MAYSNGLFTGRYIHTYTFEICHPGFTFHGIALKVMGCSIPSKVTVLLMGQRVSKSNEFPWYSTLFIIMRAEYQHLRSLNTC